MGICLLCGAEVASGAVAARARKVRREISGAVMLGMIAAAADYLSGLSGCDFPGSCLGGNSEARRWAVASCLGLSLAATRSRCATHFCSPLAAHTLSHLYA